MAPVKGKPFLEYQIKQLRACGLCDLVLCVGHLAYHVQNYFGDGRDWGVRIDYAVETDLLGTAGAIKSAQSLIGDTFLVLNGDSYLEADYPDLVRFHRHRLSADARTIGTIAMVHVEDAASYGKVETNGNARLLRFEEKKEPEPGWINGGAYVLEPTIFDLIPPNQVVSIEKETFPLVLKRNRHLFGYPAQGFFVDIGTPEGYHRFCRYVEEQTQ